MGGAGISPPSYLSQSAGVVDLTGLGIYDLKIIAGGAAATCADAPLAEGTYSLGLFLPIILYQRQFGASPSFGLVLPALYPTVGSDLEAVPIHAADVGASVSIGATWTDGGAYVVSGLLPPGQTTTSLNIGAGELSFFVEDDHGGRLYTGAPRVFDPGFGFAIYYPVSANGRGLVYCAEGPDGGARGGTCVAQ